jgi:hypothetical protein
VAAPRARVSPGRPRQKEDLRLLGAVRRATATRCRAGFARVAWRS